MAKLTIEINCDNEAFHYRDEETDTEKLDAAYEVARILTRIVLRLNGTVPENLHPVDTYLQHLTSREIDDGHQDALMDINGSKAGFIKFTN